ncbi:hypothetical protein KM1_139290 [Entamoeba histolytica HM-3:IMSS]|uniref:Uncharacterized protein n=2 Tax=Entamoeba histolytica TaxID=5759 RepID=M2RXT5_ENTHI|nr:Hypothetical protein EHI5A_031190 [Entamoeba histolytica KU27]EMS12226.1 hypothetical protein KM1_139290 [Entamoeba histolytica HM-3:IMSS]
MGEQSIETKANEDNQSKKQLVKVFRLKENDWVEIGIGIFNVEINDDSILIEVFSENNENKLSTEGERKEINKNEYVPDKIICVRLIKGDAFEKQNDKVIQIQGKAFSNEYALSFLDKNLCNELCHNLIEIGVRSITDGPLSFTEENIKEIRDLAITSLASRNTSILFEKLTLQEIINGLIKFSKTINDTTKKDIVESVFIFVKVLLLLPDEKISDEIYQLSTLKALFVILTYDPQIPQTNRIYFFDDFKTKLAGIKEIVERSFAVKNLVEYAFALTYFRDIVVARFSDESIGTPINIRLSNTQRKILEESIKDQIFQKLSKKYETNNDKESRRGISITIKQYCSTLILYPLSTREERAKSIIETGILTTIFKGLNEEYKGYYLDSLTILFESGSNVAILLMENGLLEQIVRSGIYQQGSYLYGIFSFLQNSTIAYDGVIKYQTLLCEQFIPLIMNILMEPLNTQEKYTKEVLGKYLERFSSFLLNFIKLPTPNVLPYIIQTQIFEKLLKVLSETTDCAQANIICTLKDICKLNNNEITQILIGSGMLVIIKDIKNDLPKICSPAVDEILTMFNHEPVITQVKKENIVSGLAHLAYEGIKRPIDEKEVIVLMEECSPLKRESKRHKEIKLIKRIEEPQPKEIKEVNNKE